MKNIHYWDSDSDANVSFCNGPNITVADSEVPGQKLGSPSKYCKRCLSAVTKRREALMSKIEEKVATSLNSPITVAETNETLLSNIKEFKLIKAADFDIITIEVQSKTSDAVLNQISKRIRSELNGLGLNRNLLWVYSKEYMEITFARFTGLRNDIKIPKKERAARRKAERRRVKSRRKEFGK